MRKIPPILEWIHLLASCLNYASDSIKSYSIAEVKDLKTTLTLSLSDSFQEKDESHVKTIIRVFALANECRAQEIIITKEEINVQVLLKHSYGPTQYNDPLTKKIQLSPKENSDHYKKRTII